MQDYYSDIFLLITGSQYYQVDLQYYDAYYSPYLIQYVNCVGDEDTLFNCTYYRELLLEMSLYGHTSVAAVLCQGSANQSNNSNECISGEVRLANSSNREEWRFVLRECGSVFVTQIGEELKHIYSVNNC